MQCEMCSVQYGMQFVVCVSWLRGVFVDKVYGDGLTVDCLDCTLWTVHCTLYTVDWTGREHCISLSVRGGMLKKYQNVHGYPDTYTNREI